MTTPAGTDSTFVEAKDSRQPAPHTSGYVETGGPRLHYLDYGTAGRKPMLCVHGGAAHGHWFDFVASGFTGDYHVRAVDQRGHGGSDWVDPPAYSYHDYAADLAQVAERLDLRDYVLVGHSMGGMVSLVHAATYPGRVGRLVIIDTSIKLAEDRLNAMRERGSRPGSNYATRDELLDRYRLLPAGTLASPERVRYIGGFSARQFPDGTWRHRFDRSVYAIRESLDGLPFWEKIKIPALLVKGDRSPRITPEIVANVRARCPQVEVAEVAMSEHHVTLDNPAGFVEAVSAFLARHS